MRVDLPDPDGPHERHESAVLNFEADMLERMDEVHATAIEPRNVAHLDHGVQVLPVAAR
jgi:hypothetical protein